MADPTGPGQGPSPGSGAGFSAGAQRRFVFVVLAIFLCAIGLLIYRQAVLTAPGPALDVVGDAAPPADPAGQDAAAADPAGQDAAAAGGGNTPPAGMDTTGTDAMQGNAAQTQAITLNTPSDNRPVAAPSLTGPGPDRLRDTPPTPPNVPEFDLIRIDDTGSGVVAGRAQPGATVEVIAGGAVVATAEANEKGEFVAFIDTPARDEGQILSLVARSGQEAAESTEEVLVLPSPAAEDDSPAAPVIVETGADVARVVQPSELGKVDGVTLDTISYDIEGAVRLAGRAPGEGAIRIYVDGAPVGVARSGAAGTWAVTLPGIEEGVYTLRVDALRADGSVASRAESPFQRVFPTLEQRRNASQVTVQPGNSLWVLAQDRYGEGLLYTQIFAANREAIRDPDLIYPGQIFSLPGEEEFN
ncbi:MAG: Ig-like domain-containing protein [Pseudomonadota bacterium]